MEFFNILNTMFDDHYQHRYEGELVCLKRGYNYLEEPANEIKKEKYQISLTKFNKFSLKFNIEDSFEYMLVVFNKNRIDK